MFEILISSLINTLRGKITEKNHLFHLETPLSISILTSALSISWSMLSKHLITSYFQIDNLSITVNYQLELQTRL